MRHPAARLALAPLIAAAMAAGAAAADAPVSPARVIDVVTADWTGDGGPDRAVLIEGAEDADLRIYVSTGAPGAMALAVARERLVWSGAMWGTLPELGLNAAGSLTVTSGNTAIGRSRWQETLTIAYRGGRFVVAGFTFVSHDTLEPGLGRDCDVNFLTGRGLLDGAPFAVPRGGVPLAEWSAAQVPAECAAG